VVTVTGTANFVTVIHSTMGDGFSWLRSKAQHHEIAQIATHCYLK